MENKLHQDFYDEMAALITKYIIGGHKREDLATQLNEMATDVVENNCWA